MSRWLYTIFTGNNSLDALQKYLQSKESSHSSLFILVDEHTHQYCLPFLLSKVPVLSTAMVIEIASGEQHKNIDVCVSVWNTLAELGADRKSLLINLGGGLISDLGGFVAATFKRGMAFISIPTTLLAQVDAAIGGKVGVDMGGLKNQIGLFSNPRAVYIVPDFLKTLSKRQWLSGYAEVIKYALITDTALWQQLRQLALYDINEHGALINRCVRIKNDIVIQDPLESNLRKALNFGHTIGHAVETYFLDHEEHLPLLHGEAIALGMICESYLSCKKGLLNHQAVDEITAVILAAYKPVPLSETMYKPLLQLMQHDKKNVGKEIRFSLLSAIGTAEIDQVADEALIISSLEYYRNAVQMVS